MIHTAKAWKGSTEKRSRSGNVQACYRFTTPLKLDEADYRPPAPMLFVSHALSAGTLQFIRLPAGWAGENICPPQHQFLFCLQGQLEVRTSDGKKRVFRPGAFKLFRRSWLPRQRMWFRNWATRPVLIHIFETYARLAASHGVDAGNDLFCGTTRSAAKRSAKDEARKIAANIDRRLSQSRRRMSFSMMMRGGDWGAPSVMTALAGLVHNRQSAANCERNDDNDSY